MKTLTIKQPWASLIVSGIKDIENRTWRTSFRGRIYVHSSASKAKSFSELMTDNQIEAFNNHPESGRWAMQCLMGYPWDKSSIIGEVDIVDCVLEHPSDWAQQMADKELKDGTVIQVPVWNWVLANPVMYDKPIRDIKGKLSFWELDPSSTQNTKTF